MIFVDIIFNLAKRRPEKSRHFVKEDFVESIAQKGIVKMSYGTPRSEVSCTPSEIRAWICGFHFRSRPKV